MSSLSEKLETEGAWAKENFDEKLFGNQGMVYANGAPQPIVEKIKDGFCALVSQMRSKQLNKQLGRRRLKKDGKIRV